MFPIGSKRRFALLRGLLLVLAWGAASSDQAGAQPLGAVSGELRAMGYTVEDQGWEMGDVQAVRVTGKRVEVASDPLGRGVGIVVREPGIRRR